MLQSVPQLTPFQLLETGHRAESDGNVEAAIQFYRQVADQYAYSAEAGEALGALARIHAGRQPKVRYLNGPPQRDYRVQQSGPARKVWRNKYPAPPNHYWTGKLLARLISVMGWGIAAAAMVLAPVHLAVGWPVLPFGALGVASGALGAFVFGLLMVSIGQASRALFDQANATRELVAIERAKAGEAA